MMICFGDLNRDVAPSGLSCLGLGGGLGGGWWGRASRLSEYQTKNNVMHSVLRQKSII